MINVSMDARPFIKDMDTLGQRQIPFAMMKTINETAEDFQAEQQELVARKFTLRRPTFIMNTVKINRGDFATKDNLRAIVRIDPDRDVLSKFEDQGQKTPMFAGHALAIPIEAKRSKQDIVQNSMRPRALQLTQVITAGSQKIAKGLKRTFLIQRADGSGGIYQRQGSGIGSTIHMLFSLKTKVPLPRTLAFVETAKRVCGERMPINWEKWIAQALRTAR
jgi:hypothetical protein